jgi:WD40 repeat protein/nucleoside phosphorylase
VTPDGQRVVSASHDETLKVWDLETGALLATLEGHASGVSACAVTPNGRRLVSASWDRNLKVWDLGTGALLATLEGHAGPVNACAVTPDGRRVVSASHDETLKVWGLETGALLATLAGHAGRVSACAVTPDGQRVVSASHDETLKVWDLETGALLTTLEGHAGVVTACAVTPDGRRVVSTSNNNTLKVWDLETGARLATLAGYAKASWYPGTPHARVVTACAVTPEGQRVVSASYDKTLKVWDLETGALLATLEHAGGVTACEVTPDGRRVVSASGDRTLKVWDLETGALLATMEDHAGGMTTCEVTPDGRRVVSASWDRTLKVWDLGTGALLTTLEGHADWVTAYAVTPDGRRVVSASADNTLKVWDLASGACLLTHYANAAYTALIATSTAIVGGDIAGDVWFLDWPSPKRQGLIRNHDHDPQRRPSPETEPASQRTPMKHTILFLAANPLGTDRLALDREARAIQVELERSGFRDSFELVTRWAAEPLDLLRELRKLKPTVVHFSGHGSPDVAGARAPAAGPNRDVIVEHSLVDRAPQHGLFFQDPDGRPQLVSTAALEDAFDAAGSSVKLVVLSACYSEPQARALVTRVDCVLGMRGSIRDDAARSFAIGFYGGLGERESVAAAYKQGCAAIRLEGLHDEDRPQLQTRHGVDAARLILASAPQASRPSASATTAPPQSQPGTSPGPAPKVDIGILTIRDDEFLAVLAAFPDKAGTHKGASREYTLRHASAGGDKRYRIAVSRLIEQGNGEAQDAARDLIDDLAPRLLLVVGIAGAPPSEDVKLGDVVVSTRIHDFTVEARKAGQEPAYSVTGGPIDKALAAFVTNLAAREDELGSWTADLPPPPLVAWESEGQLYGPPDWRRELRDKLAHHHEAGSTPGAPVYSTGPIAASDRLVKDPELLIPWLRTARDLRAIEMESAGVYRAVRGRCPMLAIRGISDIVGLKRSDAWTKYACAAAAAFTRAFLRTRPVGDPS